MIYSHFLQKYLLKKQLSIFYTKFMLINQVNHSVKVYFQKIISKITKECIFFREFQFNKANLMN